MLQGSRSNDFLGLEPFDHLLLPGNGIVSKSKSIFTGEYFYEVKVFSFIRIHTVFRYCFGFSAKSSADAACEPKS